MPYWRSRVAKPRSLSGLPLRSLHGASAMPCNARKIGVGSHLAGVAEYRFQIGKQADAQARLDVVRASLMSALAAVRARLGQSPPAALATAMRASHTSASRSSTPAGISGHAIVA